MKILRVLVFGFLAAGLVFAQHHTSSGSSTGSAHSSAHLSTGGHVNNSSVANHGGGYAHRPVNGGWHGYGRGRGGIYAYPVYVGGYGFYGYPYGYGYGGYGPYDSSSNYDDSGTPGDYPDQSYAAPAYQPARPVMITPNFGPDGEPEPGPNYHYYRAPAGGGADTGAASEPSYYLIAFKDHTIYSAVAYYVQGDTLHYFTQGNVHNQASVALVDRDLTDQLNRERNVTMQLGR